MATLIIENDKGTTERLDSPSWMQFESAVRTMNGATQTEVGLFVDDDTYIQIGGGGGHYVCSIRAEGKLHSLYDGTRSTDATIQIVVGQPVQFPANECFDVETIVDVCRMFWHERRAPSRYQWRQF